MAFLHHRLQHCSGCINEFVLGVIQLVNPLNACEKLDKLGDAAIYAIYMKRAHGIYLKIHGPEHEDTRKAYEALEEFKTKVSSSALPAVHVFRNSKNVAQQRSGHSSPQLSSETKTYSHRV